MVRGIGSRVREAKRLTEVASVLFNEGFGFLLAKVKLTRLLPIHKKVQVHKFRKPNSDVALEVRVRRVLEKLGGAYVKFGQLLSLRPDLIPANFCEEFRKLQDRVKPVPFSTVKGIVERELGKPINEVFLSFDSEPIGSASVAQVHRAVLKGHRKVVVKVQRPRVAEHFFSDIEVMYRIAHHLEKYIGTKNFSPVLMVEEFERYTKKEVNFLNELHNIVHFHHNFLGSKQVKIPKPYEKYSTNKVLTMEYLEGKKLSLVLGSGDGLGSGVGGEESRSDRVGVKSGKGFDRKAIAEHIVQSVIKQVFEMDLFHADLHPGNVVVFKDGKIGLIDFGIMGSLGPRLRRKGAAFYLALVGLDPEKISDALLDLGNASKRTDIDAFRDGVEEIVERWSGNVGEGIGKHKITALLHQLLDCTMMHKISMPKEMIMLGKAMVTAEGTCAQLSPDLDFVKTSKPVVDKLMKKELRKKFDPKKIMGDSVAFAQMLSKIPKQTIDLVSDLQRKGLQVDVADEDIKRLGHNIDTSSNRLSFAMIIAALIIGGSTLIAVGGDTYWSTYFAIGCLVVALVVAFFFFYSIAQEDKKNVYEV